MNRPAALVWFPRKVNLILGAVRIEQSLFALPYGYLSMLLAAGGLPTGHQFLWITVAMFSARTVGFVTNRVLDRSLDAANPRTASRALPQGLLRPGELVTLGVVCAGLFVLAAAMLNMLTLALVPVALVSVIGYSFVKRFSWASPLAIGWVHATVPAGAWIGVTGTLSWEAVLLGFGAAMFVAGLDTMYHLQHAEVYHLHGLHSISQRFGVPVTLKVSLLMHIATAGTLLALGVWMELAFPYYIGWALGVSLLAYQHTLVSPTDLSHVDRAALRTNQFVGPFILAGGFMALYV